MAEDNTRNLPLRTLHEFLFEITEEWNKFRRGSLLSIVTTIILFIIFIPRYFLVTLRQPGVLDTYIAIGIIVALVYTSYLAFRQYQFYQKWERRLDLLLHFEEELLDS